MKRYLIFAAIGIFAGVILVGCNGDNSTSPNLDPSFQNQQVLQTTTDHPSTAVDSAPVEAEDSAEPASREALCFANNFVGQRFRVISYAELIITASIEPFDCTLQNDRLKGEVRRPGIRGLREFVGDVRFIRGNRIKIYTGKLPKSCLPKKGELLKIIWKARRR